MNFTTSRFDPLFALLVLASMCGEMLFGQMLKDFHPYEPDAKEGDIVSLDFERGCPDGLKLAKGYECGWGFGENANGGLVLRRSPGEEYVFSSLPVDRLETGKNYRLQALVRLSGVRSPDGNPLADSDVPVVGLDFMDKAGSYLSSAYFNAHVKNGECDWMHLEGIFELPVATAKAVLVFFLKEYSCRSCQWDNISVKLTGKYETILYPVMPKMLRLDEESTVKMRTALLNCEKKEDDFVLFALLPDRREFISAIENGFSTFRFGELPEGVTHIRFLLGDKRTMKIVAQDEYPFLRTTAAPPEGAVTLDETGRFVIDGKPFFPLGMFWEDVSMREGDIDRMKAMGVNCVLPYLSFRFRLPAMTASDNTSVADIRRSMDILHRNGIKLIFSMLDVYGHHGDVRCFEGVEGMENIVRAVVNGLKDHPALLGWYISDENPLGEVPMLRRLRQLINGLDPFHPVFTLTFVTSHFVHFAPTGDIFLSDCYPIRNDETQSMSEIRTCLQTAQLEARIGLGWVPQIFNWGIYQIPNHPGQPYDATRYPTEEEMRSHNLLALNHRARAVIPYAYNSVARHDHYDPGASVHLWPKIADVLKLTKELAPFFLESAEPVRLFREKVGSSLVEACRHTADDGRQIIVVTSDGPGAVNVIIPVGRTGLKSRFGHTKDLGDGVYEFSAVNTAADLLE